MKSLTAWQLVGLTAVAIAPAAAMAQPKAETVTFAKDVAPILQQKCQNCHRPGSIAPMSLVTYEDARRFAPRIRARVAARVMPPWHIDKTVGIQAFQNDRSLTEAQIDTIVKWVDAGTPFGDAKDLPAPIAWPDPAAWQLQDRFGAPDLVIKSLPYSVQSRGQDKWWRPVVDAGVTEPRWVRAIEVKPSIPGRK